MIRILKQKPADPYLNAIVILDLCDLHGVDYLLEEPKDYPPHIPNPRQPTHKVIKVVRHVYAKNAVDLSVCGG